ncbi:nuclease-related domain-containing protein [Herbiconiux sp. L3-i23]|uniref:nuclease-related domain-containing protein n=1 Tax=Herbiconiux sp. L3-i23 TaxID=2905871 RepID=UPI0020613A3B|nr:nuclease-related domain-containing protein [Herbiconiux sp. L3-i23]BDI22561.1 hypothetical protein L3i23_13370 [Herbiconiux sp. L3-i23]
MADLRSRVPGQSLMEQTLALHPQGFTTPSGEALSWYRGALGEIAVAGVLSYLDADWAVLHSVPVGTNGADIDHVVIGPPGVFTINTKSHPRQDLWIGGFGLIVGGHKTNYVNKAAFEAERADSLLAAGVGFTVPVTPLIVFVNPGTRTTKAPPEKGVQVLADWELLHFLQTQRREFSQEQVQRIAFAAARPETWNASPTSVLTSQKTILQFNAIVARSLQGAQPAPIEGGAPAGAPATAAPPMRRRAPSTSSTPARRRPPRRRAKRSPAEALVKVALTLGGLWIFLTVVIPTMLAEMSTP